MPPLSQVEILNMSKKQLIVLTIVVAALPAAALVFKMLFSLLHLLSDQSSASAVLWIVYVICLLGSAFIALLPLFLFLYYPAEGFVAAGAAALQTPGIGDAGHSEVGDDEDAFGDEEAAGDEYADDEDEGEQLFDDDALESDDDEFDGGFDDDDR